MDSIGHRMVRVGSRACRVDAVLGFYPGSENKEGARGCWVVIRGQDPLSLAWSVETAWQVWNRRRLDLQRYASRFDGRGRPKSDVAELNSSQEMEQVHSCMLETDTDPYRARQHELWGPAAERLANRKQR